MSTFPVAQFGATLAWAAGAELVVLAATFLVARIAGRHSAIDSAWGLLFVAVAIVAFVRSDGHGDLVRRWLLLGLIVVWGLRLAVHLGRRMVGKPEDPRYERLLAGGGGVPDRYALLVVYLPQGALAFVVAGPVVVGMYTRGATGTLAWIGVGVWAVGVFYESVGDLQLERFRRDPANRGAVMDRGLWRYTRHPNYFGDACVWWGVFLVAAQSRPGALTFPAPIVMTLLLTLGSGTRIMERHMAGRPGWDDYAARTSMFVPLPPRRSCRYRKP